MSDHLRDFRAISFSFTSLSPPILSVAQVVELLFNSSFSNARSNTVAARWAE
jgi:hypothetical protein